MCSRGMDKGGMCLGDDRGTASDAADGNNVSCGVAKQPYVRGSISARAVGERLRPGNG